MQRSYLSVIALIIPVIFINSAGAVTDTDMPSNIYSDTNPDSDAQDANRQTDERENESDETDAALDTEPEEIAPFPKPEDHEADDTVTTSEDIQLLDEAGDALTSQFDNWVAFAEEDLGFETKVKDFRVNQTDEVTGFAETIDVAEKSKGVTELSEVLSNSVGVQVRSMGGLGSYGAASIRGSTPNQVPVFLDSVQLNTGGFSAVNLGDFSLDVLDSIEVYRGSTPLALGTGGIGGAIVLRTRALKEPVIEAAGSYGSWNTWRGFGLWGDSVGKTDVLAIASMQHSDGDFWYFNQQGTFRNPDDDLFQYRTNNDHTAYSTLLKLRRDMGKWSVTATDHFYYSDMGLAGLDSFAERSNARTNTLRNSADLHFMRPVAQKSEIDLSLTYLLLWELFDDRDGLIGTGHQDHKYRTDGIGGSALLKTTYSDMHSTVFRIASRLERYGEFRKGRSQEEQQSPTYRVKTEMGGEYDFHPWTPFHVVPTLRGELLYSYFGGGSITSYVDEFEAADKTNFYFSPSIGTRYEPKNGLQLRANGGRYVRTPDLTELFGDRGAVIGNPDLVAESGYNVDAGVTWKHTGASFLDFLRLDAAWFASWVDDLISLEQNSQSTSHPVNVGKAKIQGVELAMNVTMWNLVTLTGNYTLFQGVDKTGLPQYDGKKLPVRPTHEMYGCIKLEKKLGRIILGGWFDADYAGKAYLGRYNNEDYVSKHYYLGLGSRVGHPGTGFTFTFEIKNILDKLRFKNDEGDWRAMTDYGRYPLPGRTLMATLHWRLPQ